MYGIRHRKHKSFLKVLNTFMCEDEAKWELGFSTAIELNVYVNESLGFICDVMLRETNGYSYAPDLQRDISVHDLEVVSLLDMSVVPVSELLDGREIDELPPHQESGSNKLFFTSEMR